MMMKMRNVEEKGEGRMRGRKKDEEEREKNTEGKREKYWERKNILREREKKY